MDPVTPQAESTKRSGWRRRVLLVLGIAAAVVVAGLALLIGGGLALERIDAMSGGIPLPDGFPSDFPVYPGATAESTEWDSSQQQGRILWLSTHSKAQIVEYYNKQLAQGDWEDRPADATTTDPRILFRRKSQPTYGGTLTIHRNPFNGVTRVSVEMAAQYWKAPVACLCPSRENKSAPHRGDGTPTI
jgi:hypothetical protein